LQLVIFEARTDRSADLFSVYIRSEKITNCKPPPNRFYIYMDLNKIKKIYLIGIKGVGMTMLAQYLVGQNIDVSG